MCLIFAIIFHCIAIIVLLFLSNSNKLSIMTPTIHKTIEICPICQDHLVITRLQCHGCGTEIHGAFEASVFSSLSAEDQAFAELFIRLRGNVKEMERELGVAYNAVRSQLDRVIKNLGSPTDVESDIDVDHSPRQASIDRRAILDQLESGEISADEAVELLSDSPETKEARDE